MLERLINMDKALMLDINGLHTPFLDRIMVIFSAPEPWIPMYFAIALFLFFNFKWETDPDLSRPKFHLSKKSFYNGAVILLGIILAFALTDILSTQIKHAVQRPRPCYDPQICNLVRMLEGKGGAHGFISSHAANTFGLATITSFIFRKKAYTITIFFWAFMVSYSRIYVGKHFPLDVICGAIFGILTGIVILLLIKFVLKKCTT